MSFSPSLFKLGSFYYFNFESRFRSQRAGFFVSHLHSVSPRKLQVVEADGFAGFLRREAKALESGHRWAANVARCLFQESDAEFYVGIEAGVIFSFGTADHYAALRTNLEARCRQKSARGYLTSFAVSRMKS
ncbi:MAG: hypothetical protein E5X92_26380, partial [Mesorhizobium sp.]